MSYAEQLRDPRWQRKRLEVMQRADFACEACGSKTVTLNVHHTRYVTGRKPWEYAVTELRCLCEPCHKLEHDDEGRAEVARAARRKGEREEKFAREHPEEAPLHARMAEIDRAMPGADNDTGDALTLEKMVIRDRLSGMGSRRWKQWRSA